MLLHFSGTTFLEIAVYNSSVFLCATTSLHMGVVSSLCLKCSNRRCKTTYSKQLQTLLQVLSFLLCSIDQGSILAVIRSSKTTMKLYGQVRENQRTCPLDQFKITFQCTCVLTSHLIFREHSNISALFGSFAHSLLSEAILDGVSPIFGDRGHRAQTCEKYDAPFVSKLFYLCDVQR